jgi:DNA helicase-2/ATP-dependent DNA helicase PcrA
VAPDSRPSPALPPAIAERLARLAPDQRAAATAPPGPVLCIAPAGSGKTTTLVARVAWLVATGVDPAAIAAITFNARAAEELRARLTPALEPLGAGVATGAGPAAGTGPGAAPGRGMRADVEPPGVRVRTFHALGLEILGDAGRPPVLVPRERLLRQVLPEADAPARRRLDDAFSRLKLDLGVTAEDVARDPEPGPVARAFLAYERALAGAGTADFDDLVAGSLRALESDPPLLARWRARCAHLLVDEAQDVDRSQLELALLLAAPANRIFLVGDDDQSIYGWRLADVRRVLGLAARLPGLRRVDLEVNYRCPAPVLVRAVRLVENNEERFSKAIRAGPGATGRLVLAPLAPRTAGAGSDDIAAARLLAAWPADGSSRAVLGRTRRELLAAVAACLAAGVPFRADAIPLPLDDPRLDGLLAGAEADPRVLPLAARLATPIACRAGTAPGAETTTERTAAGRGADVAPTAAAGTPGTPGAAPPEQPEPAATCDTGAATPDIPDPEPAWTLDELRAALVGWAVGLGRGADLRAAVDAARARLAALRRPDATLVLATAHATKGLEWDHVAVVGMTEGRFPSARSLRDAADPARALEEERRLAYVAWTRARRSLTLVYDPDAPSPFLREAFDDEELGVEPPDAP